MVVTNAEENPHGYFQTAECNHWQQPPLPQLPQLPPARYPPVSQAQRHGADLPGRKSGDEGLHLAADAPHELGHGGAVDAAQVQLFLRNMRPSDTTYSASWWNRFRYKLLRTHFNDATQFRIAYGELFMSFLGNNFLQRLLQTLAEFSLNKGGGSLAAKVRRTVTTRTSKNKTLLVTTVIISDIGIGLHFYVTQKSSHS